MRSASHIRWRQVESSAVSAVGWDDSRHMYVQFVNGRLYRYEDVPRQRVVACARARSVGQYVARKIIPVYLSWRIDVPDLDVDLTKRLGAARHALPRHGAVWQGSHEESVRVPVPKPTAARRKGSSGTRKKVLA